MISEMKMKNWRDNELRSKCCYEDRRLGQGAVEEDCHWRIFPILEVQIYEDYVSLDVDTRWDKPMTNLFMCHECGFERKDWLIFISIRTSLFNFEHFKQKNKSKIFLLSVRTGLANLPGLQLSRRKKLHGDLRLLIASLWKWAFLSVSIENTRT